MNSLMYNASLLHSVLENVTTINAVQWVWSRKAKEHLKKRLLVGSQG